MRLFLDHDVYAGTASLLRSAGHDVLVAREAGCSGAPDTDILRRAREDHRVLLTRDRDFGGLVFTAHLSAGVIYLRLTPPALAAVHNELLRILSLYTQQDLHHAFVVVEPGRHRYRHLPRPPSPLE